LRARGRAPIGAIKVCLLQIVEFTGSDLNQGQIHIQGSSRGKGYICTPRNRSDRRRASAVVLRVAGLQPPTMAPAAPDAGARILTANVSQG